MPYNSRLAGYGSNPYTSTYRRLRHKASGSSEAQPSGDFTTFVSTGGNTVGEFGPVSLYRYNEFETEAANLELSLFEPHVNQAQGRAMTYHDGIIYALSRIDGDLTLFRVDASNYELIDSQVITGFSGGVGAVAIVPSGESDLMLISGNQGVIYTVVDGQATVLIDLDTQHGEIDRVQSVKALVPRGGNTVLAMDTYENRCLVVDYVAAEVVGEKDIEYAGGNVYGTFGWGIGPNDSEYLMMQDDADRKVYVIQSEDADTINVTTTIGGLVEGVYASMTINGDDILVLPSNANERLMLGSVYKVAELITPTPISYHNNPVHMIELFRANPQEQIRSTSHGNIIYMTLKLTRDIFELIEYDTVTKQLTREQLDIEKFKKTFSGDFIADLAVMELDGPAKVLLVGMETDLIGVYLEGGFGTFLVESAPKYSAVAVNGPIVAHAGFDNGWTLYISDITGDDIDDVGTPITINESLHLLSMAYHNDELYVLTVGPSPQSRAIQKLVLQGEEYVLEEVVSVAGNATGLSVI